MAMSQQISSVRNSRLLHPNLVAATNRPNDSSGPFYPVYVENSHFLVGHRAAPGETQGFRRGRTPHGERSLPIRPQGKAPLYILHTYMYTHGGVYLAFCFRTCTSQTLSPGP